jgi:hypothetical protein
MFNHIFHKKKKNIKFSYDQNLNLNIFFSNFIQNFPIIKIILKHDFQFIPFFPIIFSNRLFFFKFNLGTFLKKNFVREIY